MPPSVCFLVIASDGAEYEIMKTLWRLHARRGLRPGSELRFLHGASPDGIGPLPGCPEDWVFPAEDESLIPGILKKTMAALRRCEGFDVVVRTNLSSVYVFERLYEYVDSFLMRAIDAAGCSEDLSHFSGCNLILSRKAVRYILDNERALDFGVIDDVALSQLVFAAAVDDLLVKEWIPRLDFIDDAVVFHSNAPGPRRGRDISTYHHIRLKSGDRGKDIARMYDLLSVGAPTLIDGDSWSE